MREIKDRKLRKTMIRAGKLWSISLDGLSVYVILMDGNLYEIPAPPHSNFKTFTTEHIKTIIGIEIVKYWFA